MPTRVRFRFNRVTGEVEEFLVDDQDRNLAEAEHDRIATTVGRVLGRHPTLSEVTAAPGPVRDPEPESVPTATDRQPRRQRQGSS